ncbi:MAG: histidine phosphatase family protein [Lachnospiraceae bacterium]|nr:histidine phosphatase family protein [Lachnospiraceae bacterium]
MRIIFIRHGDPDYVNDALTPKGIREAKLLSDRLVKWPTKQMDFYCSPLGRAKQTASYTLERIGRTAEIYDWMKEFYYRVDDPTTDRIGVPWDFMPEYWTEIPEMYDKDAWKKTDIYSSNPELVPAYQQTCDELDRLIEKYGYKRHHNYYINTNTTVAADDISVAKTEMQTDIEAGTQSTTGRNDTIVIFCHLGITCVMMSHLLGISPALLCHAFYLAPTSVTILATEERQNNIAAFRAQVIGDTNHLLQGGEPISAAGYFTDVFQG